tara:strand:- start:260 stop:652 length:393 start_codon:yes stop_codon:yes gene_type:complete
MVKLRECSKCLGATILSDDGNKCVICGYTDYSTAPNKIKKKKNNTNELDRVIVRKEGNRYLNDSKTVYVMGFINGYGNKALRYEMDCPYDNCEERCASSKYPYNKQFKYKCNSKHIWYLIMKDEEPIYWR